VLLTAPEEGTSVPPYLRRYLKGPSGPHAPWVRTGNEAYVGDLFVCLFVGWLVGLFDNALPVYLHLVRVPHFVLSF
jgi:hypothetical protein